MSHVLSEIHGAGEPFTCLITGAAYGADTLAAEWATRSGVQVVSCPANWSVYGKGAGHVRNRRMLELGPDLVVAFPGGRGTADMIRQATSAGVKTIAVVVDEGLRYEQVA